MPPSPTITASSPDRRLGVRLVLALVATFLLAVPFMVLLTLVAAHWQPLLRVDQSVANELHETAVASPALVRTQQVISTVFDPNVFRVIAALAATWLFVAGRSRLAIWTLVAIFGAALLGWGLKPAVGRARPLFDDAVATAPGQSFPSGHAVGSAVGAGVLLLLVLPFLARRWQRIVAWAVAIMIPLVTGLSRVGLGVHFLSDVVAGWILGVGWLVAAVAVFQTWRREVGLGRVAPQKEGLEPELTEVQRVPGDPPG
jgi:membrane-associated phospholipid phosphatase